MISEHKADVEHTTIFTAAQYPISWLIAEHISVSDCKL